MNIATIASIVLIANSLPGSATADTGLGRLGWMTGHWCSDAGESRIEELWLPSPGHLMLGLNQTTAGDRTKAFEYLRIVADADHGVSYIAQPGGSPPTAFRLSGAGQDWVRFENPDHDFPRKIEYRRAGHVLTAEILGPGDGDAVVSIAFEFTPCKDE